MPTHHTFYHAYHFKSRKCQLITHFTMPTTLSQTPIHHTFYHAYHFKSRKCQLITLFTMPVTLRIANANSSHISPCLPLYRKRLFITNFTTPAALQAHLTQAEVGTVVVLGRPHPLDGFHGQLPSILAVRQGNA